MYVHVVNSDIINSMYTYITEFFIDFYNIFLKFINFKITINKCASMILFFNFGVDFGIFVLGLFLQIVLFLVL